MPLFCKPLAEGWIWRGSLHADDKQLWMLTFRFYCTLISWQPPCCFCSGLSGFAIAGGAELLLGVRSCIACRWASGPVCNRGSSITEGESQIAGSRLYSGASVWVWMGPSTWNGKAEVSKRAREKSHIFSIAHRYEWLLVCLVDVCALLHFTVLHNV